MNLDAIKDILAEHFTNYAVVVLDEETGVLEFRYNNEMIGKMLFKEATKEMESYDVDDYEVVWDEEEFDE
jgi:uracil phosphoribosyltransferase